MIEQILKNSFPIEYGLDSATIIVPVVTYNAPFDLTDHNSCSQCKGNPSRVDRIRVILKHIFNNLLVQMQIFMIDVIIF